METENIVKYMALTFDDGPNTEITPKVLDLLEKYQLRASFFVVGNEITKETVPVMQRAHAMGCEIHHHSKTHSVMTELSIEEIKEEMDTTTAKIIEAVGEKPQFFRPPYIALNETMYEQIALPFICGYGVQDWEEQVSAKERAEGILSQAADGSIVLLHDMRGNIKTVQALDEVIPILLKQNYRFVTVSELFHIKGVTPQHHIIYTNVLQTA